jgi:hypothetical protein
MQIDRVENFCQPRADHAVGFSTDWHILGELELPVGS